MKRLIACLIAVSFVCCLSVGLVGCGPDYRENFAGSWRVVSLTDSSGNDRTATVEQLAAADKYITLTLDADDDQAFLDMAGQTDAKGTWKPTGEYTCMISLEGYDDIPATLSEDGLLSFDEKGQIMTFERPEAEPSDNQSDEEQPADDQSGEEASQE